MLFFRSSFCLVPLLLSIGCQSNEPSVLVNESEQSLSSLSLLTIDDAQGVYSGTLNEAECEATFQLTRLTLSNFDESALTLGAADTSLDIVHTAPASQNAKAFSWRLDVVPSADCRVATIRVTQSEFPTGVNNNNVGNPSLYTSLGGRRVVIEEAQQIETTLIDEGRAEWRMNASVVNPGLWSVNHSVFDGPASVTMTMSVTGDVATEFAGFKIDLAPALLSCGDGVLDAGEECDDANLDSNDGCDLECQLEAGCQLINLSTGVEEGFTLSAITDEDAHWVRAQNPAAPSRPAIVSGRCDRNWSNIDGAEWISTSALCDDFIDDQSVFYTRTFQRQGTLGQMLLSLYADNRIERVFLNGVPVDTDANRDHFRRPLGLVLSDGFVVGENTLTIEVLEVASVPGGLLVSMIPFNDCVAATCGDGVIDDDEGCDDGNNAAGDGCSAACKIENAGACSDDEGCASGACDAGFCVSVCGDSQIDVGEGCDDGNAVGGDGCSALCEVEEGGICGSSSFCESGACNLFGLCGSTCGDGIIDVGEGCDDGARVSNDGCSAGCLIEELAPCTEDALCASSLCLDENAQCAPSLCGNGSIDEGEACDDANDESLDGCSADCQLIEDFACERVVLSSGVDENGVILNEGDLTPWEVSSNPNVGFAPALYTAPCLATWTFGSGNAGWIAGQFSCDDEGPQLLSYFRRSFEVTQPASAHLEFELNAGEYIRGVWLNGVQKIVETNDVNFSSIPLKVNLTEGFVRGTNTLLIAVEKGPRTRASLLIDVKPMTRCALASCGNGVVDVGEGCDDSNDVDGDGCSRNCLREEGQVCEASTGREADFVCQSGRCSPLSLCESQCGNGVVESDEGCDDGNFDEGDGCNARCLLEDTQRCREPSDCESGICNSVSRVCGASCGDGEVGEDEGCDDANLVAGDGCDSRCRIEAGEPCGNEGLLGDASCQSGVCATDVCLASQCGNGVVDFGEGCDEGDSVSGDGCSSFCLIELGRACANADVLCESNSCVDDICVFNYCGDGTLAAGEGCDDANRRNNDGCSAGCLIELGRPCTRDDACASAFCEEGLCALVGQPPRCGDGSIDSGEGCDDGNRVNADGCNQDCLLENGAVCLAGNDSLCASGFCDAVSDTCEAEPTGDDDGDGVLNNDDNCIEVSNPDQIDSDDDQVGDACDICITEANAEQRDQDGDGVGDACDNCVERANVNQEDSDGDGFGDLCDTCVSVANGDQLDSDGDGIGDACEDADDIGGFSVQGGPLLCTHLGVSKTFPALALFLLFAFSFLFRSPKRKAFSLLLVLVLPLTVEAQTLPQNETRDFSVERLRPALSKEGIIDVESGSVSPHLSFDFGLMGGYAHDPLVLVSPQGEVIPLVEHRASTHVLFQLGLFDWVQLGFDLPVVPFQSRPEPGLSFTGGALQSFGFGDARGALKFSLLKQEWAFIDASLVAEGTLPTALWLNELALSSPIEYMGEKTFTFAPALALSRNFSLVRLGANIGARIRLEDAGFADLLVTNELFYRVGGALRLHDFDVPLELSLALGGQNASFDPLANVNRNPLEALVEIQYDITESVQVFVGGGASLISGYATPQFRAFGGLLFAPRGPDTDADNDGVDDEVDSCPNEKEDKDGFEDRDGCPDNDNDNDGVLDDDDECPLQSGPESARGCPDASAGANKDSDGDGLLDSVDKCINDAEDQDGFEDEDGCPDIDNDGDSVLDRNDKCPSEKEDKDGIADDDGCPEADADNDGFRDEVDECPTEAEVVNGNADDDGCPDAGESKVLLEGNRILILDKVFFASGKSRIKKRSYSLLNQVAALLKNYKNIKRVRIEGHTDSQGKDAYNKRLSTSRAKAVRNYLVKKGIEKSRLEAIGFGEERPVADNKTKAGRAKNRRVVFEIVEMTDVK